MVRILMAGAYKLCMCFVVVCAWYLLCLCVIWCFVWQHLQDILDLNMTALDWMMRAYPEVKEREDMRRIIGRYGLTGLQQVSDRFQGITCVLTAKC